MFKKDIINEGDYAIMKRGTINQLFQVSKRKQVYLNKPNLKLCMNKIIGHAYGTVFVIKGKELQLVTETSDETVPIETSGLDNRNLIDDGKSQTLTKDEIEALKAEGVSGETIVKNLVENSSTFVNKTEYSQEKYIKKKKEKYGNLVRILKPNIRLLSELYHSHGPPKICNLRIDVLSQILAAVNVMYSGSYLVVDACLGLLVAAVLDRIKLDGKVIQVYLEPGPVSSYRQALEAMNYNKHDLKEILFGISYQNLIPNNKMSKGVTEEVPKISNISGGDQSVLVSDCPIKSLSSDNTEATNISEAMICNSTDNLSDIPSHHEAMDVQEANHEDKCFLEPDKKKAKMSRKLLRQAEIEEALSLMRQKNLDGLLLCCREAPGPIALNLLDYLAPSRPFAIHSMTLQPLVEAYDLIKTSKQAIFLKLTESWFRKYQVLPNRTHPEVYISNTSGYLLTGIKVEPVCK